MSILTKACAVRADGPAASIAAAADAPPPLDDEPWNDADRWMRRANELRTQGHGNEFVELLAGGIASAAPRIVAGERRFGLLHHRAGR